MKRRVIHRGSTAQCIKTIRRVVAVWVLISIASIPEFLCAQPLVKDKWVATVVSIQGQVQVRSKNMSQWRMVRLKDRFLAGDVINVGPDSRAAFVLKNESTLRVDQQSTLVFTEAKPQQPFLIELLNGAVHFFSRVHRSLRLVTPFVNGAVEGTEFVARVDDRQTAITLLEGRLNVFNSKGSVRLGKNQSVTAMADQPPVPVVRPRDAVHWALYYPAIIDFKSNEFPCDADWCVAARNSVMAWRRDDVGSAFKALQNIPDTIDDPRFLLYRASLRLSVGRVDEAMIDLEQARASDSQRGDALALQAVAAVVQNKKETGRQLINQAIAVPSAGSGVDMANSYVQQSFFNLDNALVSVKKAVEKDDRNALAWARLSELHLALGERTLAQSAADRAADLQPDLAHTMIVLGFARLAQIKTKKAKQAFARAISLDSAAPMARLGMGLAKIREGGLADGRGELEIAACLDPGNALIRSYLGKAYYEEKRDGPASVQLAAAKQLDPSDPTAWYYDALRKQTLNRPVEALEDLQQSIALNDNRAVYRSRLLLDEDLAVRSASLGRIYSDLGFQQLALVEGWKSLNTDPSNFSAHRFLADSYSALPRHEIARVSELLQSQLLQPININPVGPNQAESQLFIFQGTGPTSPSFNEFNSLFERNRVSLQLSGVAGENDTLGDEVVFSGVHDNMSFSLGQFHQQTDGFRSNNDLEENLYNAFFQARLTPEASIQAEARWRDAERGDLELLFDPEQFFSNQRNHLDVNSFRLGGRFAFSTGSDLIASVSYKEEDEDILNQPLLFVQRNIEEQTEGYSAELQYLLRKSWYNVVTGAGHMDGDMEEKGATIYNRDLFSDLFPPGIPVPPLPPDQYTKTTTDHQHSNAYVYSHFQVLDRLNLTGGLSYDDFDNDTVDVDQFNPKLGLTWRPFSKTTVRGSAFRVLTRTLVNDQTVEPTQVSGFNQFYRDTPGSDVWTYGAAVDQQLSAHLYGGVELALRELEVPYEEVPLPPALPQVKHADWKEHVGRAYLYWTPHRWFVGSTEYLYEDWDRGDELGGGEEIRTLTTHRLGIGGSFFHPTGVFVRLNATYTDQNGEFWNDDNVSFRDESDSFWVVDASLGYRFPKRYGTLTVEVKNVFDEDFRFQDTDPANPSIYPERLALIRLTLSF